jgi:flagellar motor protein MotB
MASNAPQPVARWTARLLPLLLVALVGAGSGGCQYDRLKQERDALMLQTQELQAELSRARLALDRAESERGDLDRQIQRLEQAISGVRAAGDELGDLALRDRDLGDGPVANTGFGGIEGVETYRSAPGQLTVRVPGDILFASGKVDLKDSAKKTLQEIAGVLKSRYAGSTIRIEGYTDTDPIKKSKWADNLELSLQRSAAVHRFLESQGVEGTRMYAAGFGAAKPAATKSRSRRVEIVVIQ